MGGMEDTGAPSSARTGRKTSKGKKKSGGFLQRLKHVMDGLLGATRDGPGNRNGGGAGRAERNGVGQRGLPGDRSTCG
jgi:hypothetical protein